jgi:NAD(P)-dependent dehydrogenase (short-subunit alcohol dehydrogenase family)
MNTSLTGQVAIVTGASRGIGREIAIAFARSGAAVVLVARDSEHLNNLAAMVTSEGGTALCIPTDISRPAAVHALAQSAVAKFGRVDVLVNNAGTNYVSSLVLSNDERWKQMFEINVFGVYYCTKSVLPFMIRAKSGRIINIASIAGVVGAAHNSAYSAAKAAVIGFTKSVALEVARLGITCNAICPWHVDTEMMHAAMAARAAMFGGDGNGYLEQVLAHHPQRRLITPKEVASLALFLSSEDAAGITGQALNQCGGVVTA